MTDTAKLLHHLRLRLDNSPGSTADATLLRVSYFNCPEEASLTVGEVRRAVEEIERMQSELDRANKARETAEALAKRLSDDCVAVLSGAKMITPERGYIAEPWALHGDLKELAASRYGQRKRAEQLAAATQRAELAEKERDCALDQLATPPAERGNPPWHDRMMHALRGMKPHASRIDQQVIELRRRYDELEQQLAAVTTARPGVADERLKRMAEYLESIEAEMNRDGVSDALCHAVYDRNGKQCRISCGQFRAAVAALREITAPPAPGVPDEQQEWAELEKLALPGENLDALAEQFRQPTAPTGRPIAIYDGKLTLTVERTDDGMVRLSFGGGFGHPATWDLTPEQAAALRRELPGGPMPAVGIGVPAEVCEPIAEYLAADPHWNPPVVRLENDKAKVTQQQCLDFIAAVESAKQTITGERTYTYREYQERFSRQSPEESDDPREVGRAMAREIINGLDAEAAKQAPGQCTAAEQAALDGDLAVLAEPGRGPRRSPPLAGAPVKVGAVPPDGGALAPAEPPSVPPKPTSPDEWQEACHEWRERCERLAGMLMEVAKAHGCRVLGEHLMPPWGHPANLWAAEWCKVRHDEGDLFIPGYLPRVIAEDLERLKSNSGLVNLGRLTLELTKEFAGDEMRNLSETDAFIKVWERQRAELTRETAGRQAAEAELVRIREALAGLNDYSPDKWLRSHGWIVEGLGYLKPEVSPYVMLFGHAVAAEVAEIVAPREQTTPESPEDQRREAMKEFSAAVNTNPDMTTDQLRRMAAIANEANEKGEPNE